jgi:hypothetical protein
MTEHPVPVRLSTEQLDRLDALALLLKERAAGARVTRSEIVRIALDRGMAVLEAELGATAARRRK